MKSTKTKSSKKAVSTGPTWNLKLLYKSPTDPAMEKDMAQIESMYADFAKKYDRADGATFKDSSILLSAFKNTTARIALMPPKPLMYFYFLRNIEAHNNTAQAKISLYEDRLTKAENKGLFFRIRLGELPKSRQQEILADEKFKEYRVLLERIFSDAKHKLTIAEEKIMNLKGTPAFEMWVSGNERILNMKTARVKGKDIPLPRALKRVTSGNTFAERKIMDEAVMKALKEVAPFSENEINAIATDKKTNDELRGYKTPYEATVRNYRNDPRVVDTLVETVTNNFPLAHRFFKLKAQLLKQKTLHYRDRAAKIGDISLTFPFDASVKFVQKAFAKVDKKYPEILEKFVKNGQIDVPPRVGKKGGAYCWGSYGNPTFVLLNHVDNLDSMTTLAHEMGHAFHTELSRSQPAHYMSYSTSLAETASTLFESIALEAVFETLSDKEKIVFLHNKISDNIGTIFRQIACFNFEKDIHATVRSKGFVSKEELAALHNKNMSAYLGPNIKLVPDDGYFFVQWGHIRRFFYVYSYAYGLLVSKALLRKYRADKSFWVKIEEFLSSGGSESPEHILRKIGIDVSLPTFWQEGIDEIEKDVKELERLVKKK